MWQISEIYEQSISEIYFWGQSVSDVFNLFENEDIMFQSCRNATICGNLVVYASLVGKGCKRYLLVKVKGMAWNIQMELMQIHVWKDCCCINFKYKYVLISTSNLNCLCVVALYVYVTFQQHKHLFPVHVLRKSGVSDTQRDKVLQCAYRI